MEKDFTNEYKEYIDLLIREIASGKLDVSKTVKTIDDEALLGIIHTALLDVLETKRPKHVDGLVTRKGKTRLKSKK